MTPDEIIAALQKKVSELSDALDSLQFSFWKKTGSGSNEIQGAKMQSVNFKTGVSGWELTPDGNLEANAGTFRGTLTANSLDIPDAVTANSFHVNTAGDTWWGATTFGAAVASISKAGAAIFTNVTVNGYAALTGGTFGGNGTDGALAVTSGTTTISAGSAAILTKNYTSISITGTGKVAFSNPHANGTIIFLRSQAAVTLTSSDPALIDTRDAGAQGVLGADGKNPNNLVLATNNPKGLAPSGGTGGAAGAQYDMPNFYTTSAVILSRRTVALTPGASGAGAGGVGSDPVGGNGAGALLIECAGALNFTGTINSSGTTPAAATNGAAGQRSSPGSGGGSAGMVVILYNALTANSGTITATGGTGGASGTGNGAGGPQQGGGSGAGSYVAAGGAGGTFTSAGAPAAGNGAGGGGGSNSSGAPNGGGSAGGSMGGLVAQNTYFA